MGEPFHPLSDEEYPVTSGGVIIKKRGSHYVVKDVTTGTQGKANEDLKDLLSLCDGTRTVAGIAEELSQDYEESPKKVKKKVVKSLEFLRDLQFIGVVDNPVYTPVVIRETKTEWPLDIAYLEVTNACNLKCIHCYKTAGTPLPQELDTEDWFRIIDELKELGVMTLAFTGGEPFLREDISQILEYASQNVMGINIFTNGTLITEDVIKILRKVNPEKIMVSIDGATKETHERIRGQNTFDKTVESINILTKNKFRVRSNTVLYTENIDELESLIEMLLDKGVTEMIFDRFMDAGRGGEYTTLIPPLEIGETIAQKCSKFEKEASQKVELKFTGDAGDVGDELTPYSYCGIGTSMVTIKANGDVVLCPVLSGEEFTAGNVKDASLQELWENSPVFTPLRKCQLDDIMCAACSGKDECRGGCKARVFQYYSTFCMPDPWMCATKGQKYPDPLSK